METCRDRFGVFNSSMFNVYACAMCYHYLFGSKEPKYLVLREVPYQGTMVPASVFQEQTETGLTSGSPVYPDLDDPVSMNMVCSSLGVSRISSYNKFELTARILLLSPFSCLLISLSLVHSCTIPGSSFGSMYLFQRSTEAKESITGAHT